MITTVVFDLDDTLYDELDYCRSGFRAVARFLARVAPLGCSDDVFTSLWTHFSAGNRTRTFNAALDELGLPYDDGLIAQLIEVYRGHRPDIALPTDSRRTLDTLKDTYTLALLTDGFLPAQRLKVQALGIEGYFSAVVYTEELGRACWKPSPAGFERLIETLDVAPAQMVYVGDNETKDFIAPNRLGMLTVQLRRQRRLHTAPGPCGDEAAARVALDAIDQLPTLLVRY
jgi:putative hydrolase of the HAD superfamily